MNRKLVDFVVVASFLVNLENKDKNAMYGAISVDTAIDAFASIIDMPPQQVRDIINGAQ